MFSLIEAFHDGLGEAKRWLFVDLDFLKPDWYLLKNPLSSRCFAKTFFDDPFEKFHNCTK